MDSTREWRAARREVWWEKQKGEKPPGRSRNARRKRGPGWPGKGPGNPKSQVPGGPSTTAAVYAGDAACMSPLQPWTRCPLDCRTTPAAGKLLISSDGVAVRRASLVSRGALGAPHSPGTWRGSEESAPSPQGTLARSTSQSSAGRSPRAEACLLPGLTTAWFLQGRLSLSMRQVNKTRIYYEEQAFMIRKAEKSQVSQLKTPRSGWCTFRSEK